MPVHSDVTDYTVSSLSPTLYNIDGWIKRYDYNVTVTGKNYIGRKFFDSTTDIDLGNVNVSVEVGIIGNALFYFENRKLDGSIKRIILLIVKKNVGFASG